MDKDTVFRSLDTGKEYSYRYCNTFVSRLRGYMFQKIPKEPALLITSCNSIHMYFMSFPIDVLFLDNDYKIIKRIDALPPRRIVWPVQGAKMVLEAPVGYLDGVKEGSRLEFYL